MPRIDFDYCASSFLALRHVNDPEVIWKMGWEPFFIRRDLRKSTPIFNAVQMNHILEQSVTRALQRNKLGIMLSGGMDSAILASYLPKGTKAYTLRAEGEGAENEVEGAAFFADLNDLELHVVDVSWQDYLDLLTTLMKSKRAPIHSIEPQIAKALSIAKSQGVEGMVFGELADSLFGGLDKLVTSNSEPLKFIERYTFTDPAMILKSPADVKRAFDPFIRKGAIDIHAVLEKLFADESLNSYINPCISQGVKLIAPFAGLRMGNTLNIDRIRSGDSKYLIRELFKLRYPDLNPLEKNPMPRAVGIWLRDWGGPLHPIFLEFDINSLTSDQKWHVFTLEKFTEMLDKN